VKIWLWLWPDLQSEIQQNPASADLEKANLAQP